MKKESKQLVKESRRGDIEEWLDSSKPLPLNPSTLNERFAIQLTIFPSTQECIARFSAQILLASFYMANLDNYRRMFEADYPEGEIKDLEELQAREQETERWLSQQLPRSLENLGQRISSLEEYKILCRLLENTRQKIARRQRDYKEFCAQLSFFDEPKKFFVRVNEALGHSYPLSGRGEVRTVWGVFKGTLHGHMVEYRVNPEFEKSSYAFAE